MAVLKQQLNAPIPTGEYLAEIGSIVLEPSKFEPGKEQVRVRFDVLEPTELKGRSVFAYASAVFAPSSKLFQWAKAAFGDKPIPPSYDLDTTHLEGRTVRITVVVRAGEDGTERNRVDSVRAVANGRSGPTAAQTPGPAPTRTSPGGAISRTGADAQPAADGRAQVNQPGPDEAQLPDWLSDPGADAEGGEDADGGDPPF